MGGNVADYSVVRDSNFTIDASGSDDDDVSFIALASICPK